MSFDTKDDKKPCSSMLHLFYWLNWCSNLAYFMSINSIKQSDYGNIACSETEFVRQTERHSHLSHFRAMSPTHETVFMIICNVKEISIWKWHLRNWKTSKKLIKILSFLRIKYVLCYTCTRSSYSRWRVWHQKSS